MKVLWMALLLSLCTTLFSAGAVSAQDWDSDDASGSTYDWRSGNRYNWDRESDGSTTVDGYNLRTGSTWRTEIESDGDMNGRDSRGNLWQYDASSGFYTNTDGTICTGKGVLRTCN